MHNSLQSVIIKPTFLSSETILWLGSADCKSCCRSTLVSPTGSSETAYSRKGNLSASGIYTSRNYFNLRIIQGTSCIWLNLRTTSLYTIYDGKKFSIPASMHEVYRLIRLHWNVFCFWFRTKATHMCIVTSMIIKSLESHIKVCIPLRRFSLDENY